MASVLVRAGTQAGGNGGRMMKTSVPFSQSEVNGRNEKLIIGVEWRITVLSGSQATALSSQQFTVIQGGCEGPPAAPASCCTPTCEYTALQTGERESGTGPNHHLKSHIIHLDGNYNSSEGHRAPARRGQRRYVTDNSLPANTERRDRTRRTLYVERNDSTLQTAGRAPHTKYIRYRMRKDWLKYSK